MTYTMGSQTQFEVAIPVTGNGLPEMAPLYAVTTIGQNTYEDSCFGGPCTHVIYNMDYADTVTTCISYTLTDATAGTVDTLFCCFNQVWDPVSGFWSNIGMNTAGIEELTTNSTIDNRIFDIYGRELKTAPIGQMYIQNRKKYIVFE